MLRLPNPYPTTQEVRSTVNGLKYAVPLLALVAIANVLAAKYGVNATPYIAFGLGSVWVLRDKLHELWEGRWFIPRMAGLIVLGGLIAYVSSPSDIPVAQVATGSAVAFAASILTDTVVYAALRRAAISTRVNVSNACSALVDSYVFLAVSFGGVQFAQVFHQFTAKVAGGALVLALLLAAGAWRSRNGEVVRV